MKGNIYKAIDAWRQKNVKTIGYAELDDFLFGLPVSDKTRTNAKSALLGFLSG
jgi:hypothetical protein